MNRGSPKHVAIDCHHAIGFNEAPIHESGKFDEGGKESSDGERFNEAPIHESGKLHRRGGLGRGYQASMRPRFMNRGSLGIVPFAARAHAQLQ